MFVKFINHSEGRESEKYGPFTYVQTRYGEIITNDGDQPLAVEDVNGAWFAPDGDSYSDVVVFN